jgi:hypothetical protein
MRSSLDSTTGFAVTEQLGLTMGLPQVVDITFPILRQKTEQQLLLKECVLEVAHQAVLLGRDPGPNISRI